MKVLAPTVEEFEKLDAEFAKLDLILFAQDGNNNWIAGLNCKNNDRYKEITVVIDGNQKTAYQVFNEMDEIDYIPPQDIDS